MQVSIMNFKSVLQGGLMAPTLRGSQYIAAAACVAAVMMCVKLRRVKRFWSRSWLNRRSQGRGVLNMLDMELRTEDIGAYRNFLRMSSAQFELFLKLISCDIVKIDTNMREAISCRNK